MTILWSNNASTTVSGSITAGSTSVQLAAGTGAQFPNPVNPGDYFVATFYDQATKTINEIVHCTSRSADTCTIVRAQEGTVARAWNAGDIFANLVTAGTLAAFVQTGAAPAANTSMVYVGTDVSTTPGLIICNTTPVPTAYATGMLFLIKVANTNPGNTNLQLNGTPSVQAVRTDGSQLIAGNVIAGEEYVFIYNGTNFTTTLMPVPIQPPQTTFYVRTDGNDNNSGFANTPAAAFATIQGAINAIRVRYISEQRITIRVADGYYTGGCAITDQYMATWTIIGNTANPQNVTIDATSTTASAYPPNAPLGATFWASGGGQMTVQGFTCKAYYYNLAASSGGAISASNMYYTGGTNGGGCINAGVGSGLIQLTGPNSFSSSVVTASVIAGISTGSVSMGGQNDQGIVPFSWNNVGTPTWNYFASGSNSGTVNIANAACTFTGAGHGAQFLAASGGGLNFTGATNVLPGDQPGIVQAPGWLT